MPIAALDPLPINPLRFVPVDGELSRDERDNITHFDADWFVNYIRDWQTKCTYIQPWQFNDRVSVYIPTNTTQGGTLQLIDAHGKVWHTWAIAAYTSAPNDVIEVGNTTVQAYSYFKTFRFSEVTSLPEGIYWLYLTIAYDLDDDTVIDYYRHNITEPLSIATTHAGTTHIDYYHTTNTQDVLFRQTGIVFSKRVYADIVDYTTNSTDNNFEDGNSNTRLLASSVYRKPKYALTRRLPEWEVDKLVRAWSCNRVSVDSKLFTKEPGAQFEYGRIAKHPKVMAALAIREGDRRQGTRQIVATSFALATVRFPYLAFAADITDGVLTYQFPFAISEVTDPTEEAALVALMNTFASNQGWSGSVSVSVAGSNRTYKWTNAGADLFLSGSFSAYMDPLEIRLDTTNVGQLIGFKSPDVYVSWGDGDIDYVNGSGVVYSPTHNYASSAVQNYRIFGTTEMMLFDDGYLETVGGDVPVNLKHFEIKNSFTITTFDCAVLANVGNTIEKVMIHLCSSLATISNFSSLSLQAIDTIDFSTNDISANDEGALLIDIWNAATNNNGPIGGRVFTNGNHGPLSSLAYFAAAHLGGSALSHGFYGRNVLTD